MLNDLEKKTPSVPVTPVPAATVMVLRDTPSGIEVLMVQRTKKADFAGGALLFPGGKVDEDDHHLLASKLCDFSEAIDNELRALRIAGAREIFEEAGLLFARDAESRQLIDDVRAQVINGKYRQKLLNKELTFSQIINDEGLMVATDLLVPFAHWITPITGKKRFDTHFLIAKALKNHEASHDGSETLDTIWIRPKTAIEDAKAGKRRVVFPTRMNLKKVDESPDVQTAINIAKNTPVVTVLPEVSEVEGGRHLKIPIEAGYGISEITVDYAASDQPPPQNK